MTVLLTAFEGRDNTSNMIMNRVQGDNVRKLLLPNDFDKSAELLVSEMKLYRPDYIISMGRKPQIKRLYVEPMAHKDGIYLRTNFDMAMLEGSLKESGIPYKIAGKPGNYLCNHIYYQGLSCIENSRMKTKMVFLHTPDRKNFEDLDRVAEWMNYFCGIKLTEAAFIAPFWVKEKCND